jgi:hypothetical protein
MAEAEVHYRAPGWFTKKVFNQVVMGLTRMGLSVWGSRVLEVKGRKSGEIRRTAVNLLSVDGREYLVSPRAEGQLDLLVGRRRVHYSAVETPDDEKAPILRAYLKRWKAEVGVFFDGVGPASPEDEIASIAHKHPVFALRRTA